MKTMRKRKNDAWRETIYALYRGENNICDGTIEEISRKSGKSVKMLRWMLNPAYARRIRRPKKNGKRRNCVQLIRLDGKEEES